MPLTLVDVLVRVDHSALSLRHTSDPVPIISVSVLVEEGASTVLLVFEPVASVLSTELSRLVTPISSLTVAFVSLPESLILVAVLVELNAEAVFLVVFPVSNVARRVLPLLSLDAAIFLSLLLLYPVNRSMGTILLGLRVAPNIFKLLSPYIFQ